MGVVHTYGFSRGHETVFPPPGSRQHTDVLCMHLGQRINNNNNDGGFFSIIF